MLGGGNSSVASIRRDELPFKGVQNEGAGDSYELQPTSRTNGIGMPGYSAGWFRLRGERRALLFVTDRSRVVYVPTREGYPVLVSVQRPAEFLESIRRVGTSSR
jgi:hypothetical protein